MKKTVKKGSVVRITNLATEGDYPKTWVGKDVVITGRAPQEDEVLSSQHGTQTFKAYRAETTHLKKPRQIVLYDDEFEVVQEPKPDVSHEPPSKVTEDIPKIMWAFWGLKDERYKHKQEPERVILTREGTQDIWLTEDGELSVIKQGLDYDRDLIQFADPDKKVVETFMKGFNAHCWLVDNR